jgi:hypothetical protein
MRKVKRIKGAADLNPVVTCMRAQTSSPANPPRLLYSRKEAAFQLSESLRTIDYKIAQGTLRIIRQGGRVKITHAELLRQASLDDNTPVVPRRPPQSGTVTAQVRKVA